MERKQCVVNSLPVNATGAQLASPSGVTVGMEMTGVAAGPFSMCSCFDALRPSPCKTAVHPLCGALKGTYGAMAEPAEQVTLSFGPFTVSPHERLLTRDGIVQPLGTRAFDVLMALLSRPNEAISKWDLIAQVWPGTVNVEEANLRFHVAALRKALGDGRNGARYITTLSGRGYSFVATVSQASVPANTEPTPRMKSSLVKLPNLLQRMIGRADTIAALSELLLASRFVTIVGPGGVGKTVVAVTTAHGLLEQFAGATHFVDLGALSDPDLVVTSLLLILGLPDQTDNPLQALIEYLKDKKLLLVLDNCEHVIPAVATMAASIFRSAPETFILATSREALRVEGEHVFKLGPLALPPESPELTADVARTYPAIQLFLERATASGARIELDDSNVETVVGICRKLDGMALAIELAAGKVEAYGLHQTAALLNERLSLLWRGQRTAAPRQETLRATLDWSYGLLSDLERVVLRRLGVFVGHFTIDAVLEVVPDKCVERSVLFDAIDGLVAKSMVAPRPIGAMMRYRLLETTRAYLLEVEIEEVGLAARHAAYYRRWLEQAGTKWAMLPSADERAIHFSALHNVRAALEWCFGVNGDVRVGVELVAAAAPIFLAMSLLTECRRWSERALQSLDHLPPNSVEEMHIQAALGLTLMFTLGSSEAARAALTKSLHIAEERRDDLNQLQLIGRMHIFHERMGQFDAALEYARRSVEVSKATGDSTAIALSHSLLGVSLHLAGDHSEARNVLEVAWLAPGTERISTVHGFDHRNRAGITLSRVYWLQGRPSEAIDMARQTVAAAAQMDHPVTLCIALIWAVSVFLWTGDIEAADEHIDRFIAYAKSRSLGPYLAVGRGVKGELAIRRGDARGGIETIKRSLQQLHEAKYELLTTTFNLAIVEGLLSLGQFEESLALIDETIGLVDRNGNRFYLPELLRIRGKIVLSGPQSKSGEAENWFNKSLELARRHGALAWELRTAIELAQLLLKDRRRKEAVLLLRPILDRFAEGSDTADVRAAKKLLES